MIDQTHIIERCRQLDSEGNIDESIRLLSDSISRSPAAALYYERGCRFEEVGKPDLARGDYTNAIQLEPLGKYLVARGLLLSSRLSDQDSALRDFQQALANTPDDSDIYIHLALSNLLLGRLQRAIENASQAVELSPKDSSTHSCLGQCLLAANLPIDAVRELRVATSLAPGSANSWSMLGRALRKTNDLDGAKACIERALERDRSTGYLISYASLLLELNKPLLAIAALQEARAMGMTENEEYLTKGYLELANRLLTGE